MIGQEFGYWTVKAKAKSRHHRAYWQCECRCGTLREIRVDALRSCRRVSCGCRQRQIEEYRRQQAAKEVPQQGEPHEHG